MNIKNEADLKETLNNLQEECNDLYEKYGATDNIIQLQVAINSLRHEYDIPDASQLTESNPEFVQ